MDPVNNNKFEVIPNPKSKRKLTVAPCHTAYLNPALDLLVNEDPMVNTAMEVIPKKRKRTSSCDIAAFENTALDLGISRSAITEFLARELLNVKKAAKIDDVQNIVTSTSSTSREEVSNEFEESIEEPIYENIPNVTRNSELEHIYVNVQSIKQGSFAESDIEASIIDEKTVDNFNNISNITVLPNKSNLTLSFIDRLVLESPSVSSQSLYLDDDLNESNIMEIKTLKPSNTNPFLSDSPVEIPVTANNPFLDSESEYDGNSETQMTPGLMIPRKLFDTETYNTMSNPEESVSSHEYEKVGGDSPIYENIDENLELNKQSKILGYDVSQFSAVDILNLNRINQSVSSTDSNERQKKKNTLTKVFKTLKKTFKQEKEIDVTLNPYEVPRKHKNEKVKETVYAVPGIENPCLNIDVSDDIEYEELGGNEYETIKTLKNTQLNMNITPLAEINDNNTSNKLTPGKKVRFDSTLNQEKFITGNSFDYIGSPGFDAKLDKYQDELENCMNERKFIRQIL